MEDWRGKPWYLAGDSIATTAIIYRATTMLSNMPSSSHGPSSVEPSPISHVGIVRGPKVEYLAQLGSKGPRLSPRE